MHDSNQIAVYLNFSKAQFIGRRNGRVNFMEELISPYKRIRRFEGEGSNKTKFGSPPQFASNNERSKHNISQNEKNVFIKMLEEKLLGFDEILIFGGGKAKEQLNNHLLHNKQFNNKKITLLKVDRMTENQKIALIRDYWNKVKKK
ncbi:MAG: hypothetical protein ACQETL_02605 [Bacteroidota bacterium]